MYVLCLHCVMLLRSYHSQLYCDYSYLLGIFACPCELCCSDGYEDDDASIDSIECCDDDDDDDGVLWCLVSLLQRSLDLACRSFSST